MSETNVVVIDLPFHLQECLEHKQEDPTVDYGTSVLDLFTASRVRSVVLTPGRVASLFLPLRDDELPPSTVSGSAVNVKSLRNLIKHICHYAYSSFYLPWPVSGHPTGMRHALNPPQNKWVGYGKKKKSSASDNVPDVTSETEKSNRDSVEKPVDPESEPAAGAADSGSSYLMI